MGIRVERAEVIKSGGVLSQSNLNQKRFKWTRDSEGKNSMPRKEFRARMKHEKKIEEMFDWERQKKNRILSRIERALEGYDGADCTVFRSEIAFIVRCGISAVTE